MQFLQAQHRRSIQDNSEEDLGVHSVPVLFKHSMIKLRLIENIRHNV